MSDTNNTIAVAPADTDTGDDTSQGSSILTQEESATADDNTEATVADETSTNEDEPNSDISDAGDSTDAPLDAVPMRLLTLQHSQRLKG